MLLKNMINRYKKINDEIEELKEFYRLKKTDPSDIDPSPLGIKNYNTQTEGRLKDIKALKNLN